MEIYKNLSLEDLPNEEWRDVNRKLTKVIQYDKSGNFIAKYGTIKEASARTGIRSTAISNCLAGLSQTSGGFFWKEDNKHYNFIKLWLTKYK